MNPNHYPSLELCKRLTEAGFPPTETMLVMKGQNNTTEPGDCVCPSVAELLDKLPYLTSYAWISIEKGTKSYFVAYKINSETDAKRVENVSIPNALAEMWLWLKKNNYLPSNP